MKFYLRTVFYFSIVCVFSFSIFAQDAGGVKGKVRTTKGEGISSATVIVKQNGEDVKSASTDSKGNFAVEGLNPGNYNVVFSKNGYSSGVLYNVEVKRKKISDLGERLVLTVDQGTQVIIKGSVFAPDGRSAGGAKVEIEQLSSDGSAKKVGSGVASYSGEFTFRFAEGATKYRVTASAKDYKASKEIEVSSPAIYRLGLTLEKSKEN